jgi:hypothetical protein
MLVSRGCLRGVIRKFAPHGLPGVVIGSPVRGTKVLAGGEGDAFVTAKMERVVRRPPAAMREELNDLRPYGQIEGAAFLIPDATSASVGRL